MVAYNNAFLGFVVMCCGDGVVCVGSAAKPVLVSSVCSICAKVPLRADETDFCRVWLGTLVTATIMYMFLGFVGCVVVWLSFVVVSRSVSIPLAQRLIFMS